MLEFFREYRFTALLLLPMSGCNFGTHPVSKRTTLNRLNFLSSANHLRPARGPLRLPQWEHGRAFRTRVRGRRGAGDVTKSLWRNILLIHVRLYNLAHFYSERGTAARRARLGITQCRYSICVPYFPNSTRSAVFSFLKKKKKRKRKKRKNHFHVYICIYSLINI